MGKIELKRELKEIFSTEKLKEINENLEKILPESNIEEVKKELDETKEKQISEINELKSKMENLEKRNYINLATAFNILYGVFMISFIGHTALPMNVTTIASILGTFAVGMAGITTTCVLKEKNKPSKLYSLDSNLYIKKIEYNKVKELSKKIDGIVESREIVKELMNTTKELVNDDRKRHTVTIKDKNSDVIGAELLFSETGNLEKITTYDAELEMLTEDSTVTFHDDKINIKGRQYAKKQ